MINGFARLADGSVNSVDSLDALRTAWAHKNSIVWVDLEQPTEADLRELDSIIDVDEDALDDCLHGEQRPRIDEYEHYIFLVVYGMLGVEEEAEFAPRKLSAFQGERFLITVHRQPLRTTRAVLDRCGRSASKILGEGPDEVLFHILDGMVDKYLFVADQYETQLEDLEDRSMDAERDDSVIADAGELRSKLLELRRLAVSQRELVTPLAKGEYDYLSESLQPRFQHIADHLVQVVEVTDAVRDRLNGVRDNYHTLLANRANETMKALTMVATIMLPMTLIAGIYGMNLPVWPSGESPLSFWAVLGLMAVVTGGLLAYFRRKRWL